jgi:hypothetical protein
VLLRYRFGFVGPGDQPPPDHVYRDAPIIVGTVELYGTQRYVVESCDYDEQPPLAVLRKVLS